MKKLFYTLGILAASTVVFSCQRLAEDPVKEEQPAKKMVTLSFTAEKPGETKTAAIEGEEGVTFEWTDGDQANMKLFIVGEDNDGKETLTEVASPTVNIVNATKLTISAEVEANATYTFRAIFCDPASYTGSGDDYGKRKPKIKANQNPNGTVNFDPTADILVSDDKVVTVGETAEDTGDMLLTFDRPVVVNKMTLKNLGVGEKVSKVVIKSDKELTGFLEKGEMSGQLKEETIYYDALEVPEGGQFPVYFITMPNEGHTLTVEVTTDVCTYSKTFGSGSINFNLGEFTRFGVNLPAGTPISDLSGYYLIGCLNANKWQLMDSEIGSSTFYPRYETSVTTAASSVKFSDFSSISNIDRYIFEVEAYDGAYSIKSVNTEKYVSYTSGNSANAVDALGDNTKFNISISESSATIESVAVAGRVLRYNSGSPRFAFYGGTQNAIFMIPATYVELEDAGLAYEVDSPIEVAWEDKDSFVKPTLTNPHSLTVTYSSSNVSVATVDENTGDITFVGNGTTTITASSAKTSSYNAGSAEYQIVVTGAPATETLTYSFTISPSDFNTSSYAANNNEKSSTAICTTDNTKTISVSWTSNQVMKSGEDMQWQKNNGYIYNSTDLGTIKSVTVNSSAGTFTTYYGTSQQPSSGTTVGGGFFKISVGNATGKTSSVVVVFEK